MLLADRGRLGAEHLRRRWCRFISGAVDDLARHGGLRMYLKEFYHEKGTRTAWPYVRWHRNREDGPPEPPLDGPHYGNGNTTR